MVLAVAGAMSSKSASSASLMCVGCQPSSSSYKIRDHRMARQGLERHGGDETQRVGRHHHVHVAALLGQLARQLGGLVSGNRAGHAQNNVLSCAHSYSDR